MQSFLHRDLLSYGPMLCVACRSRAYQFQVFSRTTTAPVSNHTQHFGDVATVSGTTTINVYSSTPPGSFPSPAAAPVPIAPGSFLGPAAAPVPTAPGSFPGPAAAAGVSGAAATPARGARPPRAASAAEGVGPQLLQAPLPPEAAEPRRSSRKRTHGK
jgi:hypothetical protein